MRSVFYGVLLTVLVACAGTVHAANDLDGKAILCGSDSVIHPVYGLVFEKGTVSRYQVDGYSRRLSYIEPYLLVGTSLVEWHTSASADKTRLLEMIDRQGGDSYRLSRETLMVGRLSANPRISTTPFPLINNLLNNIYLGLTTPTGHECAVSSKNEIFKKLDAIIAAAKKKNKI